MVRDIQLTKPMIVVDEVNYRITSNEDGVDLTLHCKFCSGKSRRRGNLVNRHCTKCRRYHGPDGKIRYSRKDPWLRQTVAEYQEHADAVMQAIEDQAAGVKVDHTHEPAPSADQSIPW